MPDQESKKGEKDRPVVQSAHKDVSLDIENALSFLDSEDDEKAASPERVSKPSATSEPPTPEIKADKPIRQKETSTARPLEKEVRHSLEDQREFAQKKAMMPVHPERKKNTKIWILLSGVVVLMILAALVFL